MANFYPIMIHVFNYKDKNYIYDVGSGSLHECDKPTADYLKAQNDSSVDITYLSDDQIKEVLAAAFLPIKAEAKQFTVRRERDTAVEEQIAVDEQRAKILKEIARLEALARKENISTSLGGTKSHAKHKITNRKSKRCPPK